MKLFAQAARICEECWEDGPQLSVHLTFLYIFATSMFAVHKLRVKKSAVRVLLLSCCCILLRKQVCGLAEHVYAKSHWLKGPSPMSCPIGGRSAKIEGNSSLYIL